MRYPPPRYWEQCPNTGSTFLGPKNWSRCDDCSMTMNTRKPFGDHQRISVTPHDENERHERQDS